MSDLLSAEIARVQAGSHLGVVLPLIEQQVDEMLRAVDLRTQSLLESGKLTPEGALAAWLERSALQKVVTKLKKTLTAAVSTGERLRPQMEGRKDG